MERRVSTASDMGARGLTRGVAQRAGEGADARRVKAAFIYGAVTNLVGAALSADTLGGKRSFLFGKGGGPGRDAFLGGTMTTREIALAWRLFEANWIPLAATGLALAFVLTATDFSLTPGSEAVSFGFVVVYAAFAYYNALAPRRCEPWVVFALGSMAQVVMATVIMTPMTYAAAALNLPLQDALLARLDQAMGLDWRSYLAFVNDHPLVGTALTIGYGMIRWPIFVIPVALALAGQYRRLQVFTLAFTLGLVVTTIISAFVPAIGTFYHLGLTAADYPNLNPVAYLEQLRDLPPVRDGTLRRLDLPALTGLVTFPSFHAASAILFAWALCRGAVPSPSITGGCFWRGGRSPPVFFF